MTKRVRAHGKTHYLFLLSSACVARCRQVRKQGGKGNKFFNEFPAVKKRTYLLRRDTGCSQKSSRGNNRAPHSGVLFIIPKPKKIQIRHMSVIIHSFFSVLLFLRLKGHNFMQLLEKANFVML